MLYGPKYGDPHGVITKLMPCDDVCEQRKDHEVFGHVLVSLGKGGWDASLARYWVPDMDTEDGRQWVRAWLDEPVACPRCNGTQMKYRNLYQTLARVVDLHGDTP